MAIFQVFVWAIFTPKGRHQRHSKIAGAQNLEKKGSQYNIEMLYILTFQVLSMFSAKCLVLSRFSHFWGEIYRLCLDLDRKKIKFPGFPGSAGNPGFSRSTAVWCLISFIKKFGSKFSS